MSEPTINKLLTLGAKSSNALALFVKTNHVEPGKVNEAISRNLEEQAKNLDPKSTYKTKCSNPLTAARLLLAYYVGDNLPALEELTMFSYENGIVDERTGVSTFIDVFEETVFVTCGAIILYYGMMANGHPRPLLFSCLMSARILQCEIDQRVRYTGVELSTPVAIKTHKLVCRSIEIHDHTASSVSPSPPKQCGGCNNVLFCSVKCQKACAPYHYKGEDTQLTIQDRLKPMSWVILPDFSCESVRERRKTYHHLVACGVAVRLDLPLS